MKLLPWLAGVSALVLSSSHAFAQVDRERNYESPQNFAIELRMGLYYPKVDNEFSGAAKPFETSFGENSRLYIGGEFDWQVFRIPYVGTIGPGLGFHYLKFGRPALLGTNTTAASEEQTNLTIYPLYLQAVLRIDVLAREVGIPIVPYLKGGFGGALWTMSNGNGTAEIDEGGKVVKGRGFSYGPQFALGGAILLDWFDEYAARQADIALGINNTYIYGEFVSSHLSNINGTGMRLGADTFAAGLAFEF